MRACTRAKLSGWFSRTRTHTHTPKSINRIVKACAWCERESITLPAAVCMFAFCAVSPFAMQSPTSARCSRKLSRQPHHKSHKCTPPALRVPATPRSAGMSSSWGGTGPVSRTFGLLSTLSLLKHTNTLSLTRPPATFRLVFTEPPPSARRAWPFICCTPVPPRLVAGRPVMDCVMAARCDDVDRSPHPATNKNTHTQPANKKSTRTESGTGTGRQGVDTLLCVACAQFGHATCCYKMP